MVQGVDLSAADHTADASKKEGDSLAPPLPNCNGMPAVEGSLSKAQTITFSKVETIEPVAWMVYSLDGQSVCVTDNPADFTDQHRALPLYTAPPQSKENRDD
jgi:hypothetical protein